MAYQPSLSDLGVSSGSQGGYQPSLSDLGMSQNESMSAPITNAGSMPVLNSSSNPGFLAQHPMIQGAINAVKSIIPTPTMPLGLNVAAGALSAPLPEPYRNVMAAAPQIASGTNYGVPQRIASGIGNALPSLAAGGPNLATQAVSGFGIGAAQAPPGQRMMQGLENSLGTSVFGKVIPAFGKIGGQLLNPATAEDIANNVTSVHDAISDNAAKGFQTVSQGVNDRGISQIPLSLNSMNDISGLVNDKVLPNVKQSRDLISNALSGDYNSLRDLQSELWKKGTKAASSDSIIDNNKADEIFDLRNRINDHISNHLVNTGNEDLSNLLDTSKSNYKYLQDTFYNKNLPVSIRKLANPDVREIPSNIGNVMQKKSNPMDDLRNAITQVPQNNWLGSSPSTFNQNIASYNTNKSVGPAVKALGYGGLGLGELLSWYKLLNMQSPHGE